MNRFMTIPQECGCLINIELKNGVVNLILKTAYFNPSSLAQIDLCKTHLDEMRRRKVNEEISDPNLDEMRRRINEENSSTRTCRFGTPSCNCGAKDKLEPIKFGHCGAEGSAHNLRHMKRYDCDDWEQSL